MRLNEAIEEMLDILLLGKAKRLDMEVTDTHPFDGDGTMTYELIGYKVGDNYRIDIKPQRKI